MTKSIETIVFHIRTPGKFASQNVPDFNGIPVYAAWPKLSHHNHDEARQWARYGRKPEEPGFEPIELPNEFQAEVYHDVSYRGSWYSSKIPQALIYLEQGVDNKPCYLMVDLRVDGFVEAAIEFGIADGKFTTPMAFRFVGANYYLVPKAGTSYAAYREKFNQSQKPKTSTTTQIEPGVPFVGNYGHVYVYLGSRKCIETPIDDHDHIGSYHDQTVHVYQNIGVERLKYDEYIVKSIDVIKSKMKVKSLYQAKSQAEADFIDATVQALVGDEIDITHWSKGGYGHTWRTRVLLTPETLTVYEV